MTDEKEKSPAEPPVKALTLGEAAQLLRTCQVAAVAQSFAPEAESAEGDGFGPWLEWCDQG
jgi:hypothetical protein